MSSLLRNFYFPDCQADTKKVLTNRGRIVNFRNGISQELKFFRKKQRAVAAISHQGQSPVFAGKKAIQNEERDGVAGLSQCDSPTRTAAALRPASFQVIRHLWFGAAQCPAEVASRYPRTGVWSCVSRCVVPLRVWDSVWPVHAWLSRLDSVWRYCVGEGRFRRSLRSLRNDGATYETKGKDFSLFLPRVRCVIPRTRSVSGTSLCILILSTAFFPSFCAR